jgi:hypothetical protein
VVPRNDGHRHPPKEFPTLAGKKDRAGTNMSAGNKEKAGTNTTTRKKPASVIEKAPLIAGVDMKLEVGHELVHPCALVPAMHVTHP